MTMTADAPATESPDTWPAYCRGFAQAKQEENHVLAAVLRLVYADPHQWSKRPCQTCNTITFLTRAKFGCSVLASAAPAGPPPAEVGGCVGPRRI